MLISTCNRPISFIIAAKSYRRPIVGHFARALGAIPVERP
jgi:1-acyl-sn-glycerol-3-phosphate acyltransferase